MFVAEDFYIPDVNATQTWTSWLGLISVNKVQHTKEEKLHNMLSLILLFSR